MRSPRLVRLLATTSSLLASIAVTGAAVIDVTPTDVTTRAFSVAWVSDEAVGTATVRVFSDAAGTTELGAGLSISLSAPQAALDLGIVKVDVTGLTANTCYYFQTVSIGASTVPFPAAAPFPEVCTATSTTRADPTETLIVNDLIEADLFRPDGATPADGSLLLVALPAAGAYPVSSFAGESVQLPAAAVDLGNLFDAATGTSILTSTGDVLLLRHYRGLLCPELSEHEQVRFRRVPEHEELQAIGKPVVEYESGTPCFFADLQCDDTIDILDAQRVLNAFDRTQADCAFNADFDIVADQVINILDVQSVLNRFGQSAPFN